MTEHFFVTPKSPHIMDRPPLKETFAREIFLWIILITTVSSCQLHPAISLQQLAERHSLTSHYYATSQHSLLAFHASNIPYPSKTLHIYLEGDGSPWQDGVQPSQNPSAHNPLALKLMLKDSAASVYLNRPCYGFVTLPEGCEARLWTSARYSQEVVSSLSSAIDQIKARFGTEEITLVGYSGGGNLALLVALQREDIGRVISIAGNLDHVSWTQHFSFDPLHESLNVVDFLASEHSADHWYLIGMEDKRVPADITLKAAQHDKTGNIIRYKDFDHRCCWDEIWPGFLQTAAPK